ncbi:MAG: histidine kinase-, gyrase and HSP90-like ATPase family protein [Holophagaceae bacterium]|nr:histidine kinase-, gyrase and HSP90-like ATPase family protein [Holophagaceae bacterium]
MRQENTIPTFLNRITHRSNLLMVLLVGGLLSGFRIFSDPTTVQLGDLLIPFIFLFLQVSLAPVPWLWNISGNPRWFFVRRFIRALGFNLLWIAATLTLTHYLLPMPPHRPGEKATSKTAFPPPPPMDMGGGGPGPGDAGLPPRHRIPFPEKGLGLINLAFALIIGWELAEKELTEARERRTADLLRQSQFRALRNQLEPHVLYNALNGLSELIHEDPLAAEEVVALLANLYRMLTDYGKADMALLAEERKLVEAYLSMEQMRLGERLQVEWDWPAWADAIQAPPLFLQPLVENAIKHGISSLDTGGKLHITCQREGDTLSLQVSNTGLPPSPGGRKGVGLENLEARLGLWTGVAGAFSLERQGEWTIARVEWTPGSNA